VTRDGSHFLRCLHPSMYFETFMMYIYDFYLFYVSFMDFVYKNVFTCV
jgi:hypothetical protein